jgi:glycosyltransferase involved in cell wall biosynthesis
MSEQPLVTIITPSYNQGNFIQETIDSVLGQDYPHLEYLVFDGGSTDNTVDILRACNDPRLTWVSEKDNGQSAAINKGLRRAKGAYLTYINSDDLLVPGAVKLIVDHFEAHPEADMVYGDCQLIDASGAHLRLVKALPFELQRAVLGSTPMQPGTFWRHDVTERIGSMDESLHYLMDVDYCFRTALAGFNVQGVRSTLSKFRLHEASKGVNQKMGFWREWTPTLDKVYANADVPQEILEVKEEAYQNIEWNRLKISWALAEYDRARLRPFIRHHSLNHRVLAAVMLLESYLHLPLLKWVDEAYMRRTGKRIIR